MFPTNPIIRSSARKYLGVVVTSCGALAASVQGQIFVNATVTPLGASVRYDISVSNQGAEDLALVSINDAPLGDSLIDPSLVVPAGFLASYDGGLGFIDFLGDTSLFGAGTTVSGFSFESESLPGNYFTSFEALGVLGSSFVGSIVVVPEPGTSITAIGFVGCLLWGALRRLRQRP